MRKNFTGFRGGVDSIDGVNDIGGNDNPPNGVNGGNDPV